METNGDVIKSIDAANEAVAETLKSGVNASKAFSQDMIKDAVKE